MDLEKQKAFIVRITYMTIILALIVIGIKFLLPLLMPFVIGIIIASILRPSIDFVSKKIKGKRTLVAIVTLLVFYGIFVFLLIIFGVKIFAFMEDLFYQLPSIYTKNIEPAFNSVMERLLTMMPEFNDTLSLILTNMNDSIFSFITQASTKAVTFVTGIAGTIPAFMIRFLFTIISSFFFTIDYHRITGFLTRQMPDKKKDFFVNLRKNGLGTLFQFFKAYAMLIFVTFVELSIGFSLLQLPNPILIAAIVAIVDILPILGTGTIVIPWIIITLILGNIKFALGLTILYVIITVVRQVLEPKVVGQQIGLHPIITLICMFVGAQLFGFLGLFLMPISSTIIKKMNDEGSIHLFK